MKKNFSLILSHSSPLTFQSRDLMHRMFVAQVNSKYMLFFLPSNNNKKLINRMTTGFLFSFCFVLWAFFVVASSSCFFCAVTLFQIQFVCVLMYDLVTIDLGFYAASTKFYFLTFSFLFLSLF